MQGGDWAAKFCSQDVVFLLVQIYSSTKNENLKATTASTLARLLRHSASLVVYVVDKFGIRLFVAGLSDPSSKVSRKHSPSPAFSL
jgi:serine/threonine-protein kinase ULK4